jgi:DNA-binding NarL/FixJ family response regulator
VAIASPGVTTRVVVAEDSYLIREGLRMLFDSEPDVDLVATAGTLPELFDAVELTDPTSC